MQAELPIWVGGSGEKRTLRSRPATPTAGTCRSCRRRPWPTSATCSPTTAPPSAAIPAEIRTAVNVGLCPDDDALRAQFGGLAEGVRPGVLMGSPDQLVDRIGEYVDAGADQINIAMRAPVAARPARPGDRGDRPAADSRDGPGLGAGPRQPDRRPHRPHRRPRAPDGDRPRHHGHGRARRRRRDAPLRRREPEPAVVPLDVDDPAAVTPAWARYVAGVVAELRPAGGLHRRGRHHAPDRRRPVVVGRARGRGRAGARVRRRRRSSWPSSASAPSSERRACRAGSWTSSRRRPGSTATPFGSTAPRSTVEPGARPRRPRGGGRRLRRAASAGRRAPTPNGPPRARPPQAAIGPLARRRRSPTSSASTTTRSRRRARHVVTENQRVDAFAAALAAGDRAALREAHGRQPRQPARRLRGEHAGARCPGRRARRRSTA